MLTKRKVFFMQVELKEKKDGEQLITITLDPEELKPHLERAAEEISKHREFKGFRKGKVPYKIVEREIGAQALLEHAAQGAIQKSFEEATKEHNFKSIAPPKIEVQKIAPSNPLVYNAYIPLLPEVKLPDLKQIIIEQKQVRVDDKDIQGVIEQLRKMRAKEKLVFRAAKKGDKVKVDLKMSIASVPVEGGSSKDLVFELGADGIVPGFSEQIIGMSASEERKFKLPFPEKFHDSKLAGKEVEFEVNLKEVYEVELPEVNEDFAKGLGKFGGTLDLKKRVKENLEVEGEAREKDRFERELLEAVSQKTQFDAIPKVLVEMEIDRMIEELKSEVARQGAKFEDYLKQIKQDLENLRKGMNDTALRRVKVALILRQISEEQNINVTDSEVDEEINKRYGALKDQPKVLKMVSRASFRDYLRNLLKSDKAMNWLRSQCHPEPVSSS